MTFHIHWACHAPGGVNMLQIVYSAVAYCRVAYLVKYYDRETTTVKSRGFFSWTNEEVELVHI